MGERGGTVSESELLAYVDGQLPTAERIGVEAHLRDRPELASAVLEDLRLRDEVRLFLAEEDWPAPARGVAAARELGRRLRRRSLGARLRRVALAASLVAAGWFAHQEFNLFVDQVAAAHVVPGFAEAAAQAYTAQRAKLASGHAPDPTPLALKAERTGGTVPVPSLGPDLRRLGSDLVPWDGGVALVGVYRDGNDRTLTLFAAETDRFAVEAPQLAEARGLPTAFWQRGRFAYALNGAAAADRLLAIARAAAAGPWVGLPDRPPSSTGGTHG